MRSGVFFCDGEAVCKETFLFGGEEEEEEEEGGGRRKMRKRRKKIHFRVPSWFHY